MELKSSLASFQKDKSLGPDGWDIEFFSTFYVILGLNLLQVVNSTFIALTPKVGNPNSFEYFCQYPCTTLFIR